MIKVQYVNKELLKAEYLKLFEDKKEVFKNKKNHKEDDFHIIFKNIEFDNIITASFDKMEELINQIDKNRKQGCLSLRRNIDIKDNVAIKEVFNYDSKKYNSYQQGKISKFFQDNLNENLSSCFYCNINFINVFSSYYKDIFNFLNHAPYQDLKIGKGIVGKIRADRIIKLRENELFVEKNLNRLRFLILNKSKIEKILNNINPVNSFTLDHVYIKSEYPYLALSLFNLVPCCYTCNTKVKGKNDKIHTSPTSEEYNFGKRVKFKTFYTYNNFEKADFSLSIENKEDIEFELIEDVGDKYKSLIEVFRLNARYRYHKDILIEMINKRILYPDSRIQEISLMTSQTFDKVKNDLFGIFEYNDIKSNRPFSKLKFDIAKELGLV